MGKPQPQRMARDQAGGPEQEKNAERDQRQRSKNGAWPGPVILLRNRNRSAHGFTCGSFGWVGGGGAATPLFHGCGIPIGGAMGTVYIGGSMWPSVEPVREISSIAPITSSRTGKLLSNGMAVKFSSRKRTPRVMRMAAPIIPWVRHLTQGQ